MTGPSHTTSFDHLTIFCEAPHYAVFSILLPIPPSYVKIFSSGPCSQTHSAYIYLPLVLWTKFHTHTKQQVNL